MIVGKFHLCFGATFISLGVILVLTLFQDDDVGFTEPPDHFAFFENVPICADENVQAFQFETEPVENLPRIYVESNRKRPQEYSKNCAKFPSLFEIKYESDYWQILKTSNNSLYLYNAYLDDRREDWYVRITSVYDQFSSNDTFYCQFWYEGVKQPVFEQSEKLTWIWIKGWGGLKPEIFHPYLISCPLPSKNQIPMSVSIVQNQCDNPTNNLRILHSELDQSEKSDFVVCVKGLNFPYQDMTYRLVEWIELLFMLGANKINFYEFKIHPKAQKLLDYYVREGKVQVTPISLVGSVSNSAFLQSKYLKQMVIQRRLQEVIPYNDCFYKHLRDYKFVVLLDTDEVIVPTQGEWSDLVERLVSQNKSSYMARNVYFLDAHQHNHEWFEDIPKFMHMLQHVYRSKEYTAPGAYVKGFHDTGKILTLHNHFPFRCLDNCQSVGIDTGLAHLQHYRSDCVRELKNCDSMKENSVVDSRLWRYKEKLVERVLIVLMELGVVVNGTGTS